jgi:sugar O-acyltransferase (sialic acid O-acetyltransferase NeuD family)
VSAPRPLVVVGAGGFGRETLDAVAAVNEGADTPPFQLLGVLDDGPAERHLQRLERRGVRHLGSVHQWLARERSGAYVIAVGAPAVRRRLAEDFERRGWEAVTVVHPAATVGSQTCVGPGVIVCAGAQVSTNVQLGAHVHLNPNATVGHDSVLEDFVSVNPAAVVSGECHIGSGALLGAGSVVLQGLEVGTAATVGASACVTRNVKPGSVVVGVPAREVP